MPPTIVSPLLASQDPAVITLKDTPIGKWSHDQVTHIYVYVY
jgi:hypothetical protein